MASTTAVSTVYVQNLEERVKPEQLRESLHHIFSEYGKVIDIVAKSNLKAKGQAFVVFDDPAAAQVAVEEMQGFQLFDKPMRLAMAASRSDASVKLSGDEEEFEAHKRRRLAEKDKKKALDAAEEQKRQNLASLGETVGSGKTVRASGLKSTGQTTASLVPDEFVPPNKILFVQNLPEDYDLDALSAIFGRFERFREVRLVPGRKGIAFVEYDTEQGAITAKENTAGMQFGDAHVIKVTYQRQ